MAEQVSYQVLWPAMSVPAKNGRDSTVLSRGDKVPGHVPASTLEALASAGAIGIAVGDAKAGAREAAPSGRPNKSAKAGDWETYAIAQGVDAELAKAATKEQLVAHFYDGEPLPGETPNPPPGDPAAPPTGDGGQGGAGDSGPGNE